MKTESRKQALGGAIFFIGIVLGLTLAIAAVWGDFEGTSYFYTGTGYDSFSGLSCPILMTRSETGSVGIHFDNPSDQEIRPYYEVSISGVGATRKLEGQITVPAHATQDVHWTVGASDIDLGFFIFVQADILPFAGHSTREATCGIIVLDLLGLIGAQVFTATLAASLFGIVLGFGLREGASNLTTRRSRNSRSALQATGVTTLLAMLTGFMGLWFIGLIFCAVTILLLVIQLRSATP